MLKKMCYAALHWYKAMLSPYIGRNCKYTPTCSMYAFDAIKKHGVIKGIAMGSWRILRCNPFSKGGFDPVKENYRGNAKWLV